MILKDNAFHIMELFFRQPYRIFHIREISRLTGLSTTGVSKTLIKLKKEKLLLSKKTIIIEEITPDFDGRFLMMKRLYNVYSISNSGLVDFLKSYYEMPSTIVLFGSYSEGLDSEESDIDIAIVSGKKDLPDLKRFEKNLLRKINIHTIDIKTADNNFKNSLANGVVLWGFVEIIK